MKKLLLYLSVYLGKFLLWLTLKTCRFQVQGLHNLTETASQQPCIISLWHNRLAIIAHFLSHYAPNFFYSAFISNSRDGNILATLASSYKQGKTIRVPHNARHQALLKMTEELKKPKHVILITPDGPRGPRYKIKPGILWAAKASQAPIIPFSWTASNYWQLKTWDQLILPKPFSTITITLGPPLRYHDVNVENMQALEEQMNSLL